MDIKYPAIRFHQYNSKTDKDKMYLFAARAKDLAQWAGIPRKGWKIRMLFQRWITATREKELAFFWEQASKSDKGYILGPSAIVVAIQEDVSFKDGLIELNYESPTDGIDEYPDILKALAIKILPKIEARLSIDSRKILDSYRQDYSINATEPDCKHDYILEFSIQLYQMIQSPSMFIEANSIEDNELDSLIESMESLCRPALVVDGQHRLFGAQSIKGDVMLPVVAMSNMSWTDQIYQFVVINEKAQKVDSELLNDIFASSLSPVEQKVMREKFKYVKVDIEQRIAGVLAGRDEDSPFFNMVTLNLPNPSPSEANAYISQKIIQNLIDGGRGSKSWRNDDEFYQKYIKPTFSDREEWSDWKNGLWRKYWFTFWNAVKEHFTEQAKLVKGQNFEIWNNVEQSNLTKGVGLKIFQTFFMTTMIESIKDLERSMELLLKGLGEDKANALISEEYPELYLPDSVEKFEQFLKEKFLVKFPVRFFTATWDSGLDTTPGHEKLLFQMKDAYRRDSWRASGGGVFISSGQ